MWHDRESKAKLTYDHQELDELSRQDYYENPDNMQHLITEQPGDHPKAKQIRAQIAKLINQELEKSSYREQISEQDKLALLHEAEQEVDIRGNFYMKYDANKLKNNMRVHDAKAPGIDKNKPSYVLPHSHVHPQHYIDVDSLTEEKLWDIYALYSHLIELHITQVRPSLENKIYIPKQFSHYSREYDDDDGYNMDQRFHEYFYHFRENTHPWRS